MDAMAPQTISDRLRQILRVRGWSMKALSEKAGLAPNHVEQIVSGRVKRPNGETLAAIGAASGVSVDWIVSGKGEPPTADGPTVDREGVEPPPSGDLPAALDRALFASMDLARYETADFHAARRALVESYRSAIADADVTTVARRALDGARAVRIAGDPVTTEAILRWVAWGRT